MFGYRYYTLHFGFSSGFIWASLVAHTVKNLPAMQETQLGSLGWEDPPEEGNGYPLQYSCLENSMDLEKIGRL